MSNVEQILTALSGIRTAPRPEEYEIHEMIEKALTEASIPYVHEYRLMPGRRIDFLCGSIGIEVKKGRPASAVLRRQLEKYLSCDALSCAIVVMQKPCYLPERIAGKRVYLLSLDRLWGVALP